MEKSNFNLREKGWNVADGVKQPLAWKLIDKTSTDDAKETAEMLDEVFDICHNTGTIVFKLDYPKGKVRKLLTDNRALAINQNEIEAITKFIDV